MRMLPNSLSLPALAVVITLAPAIPATAADPDTVTWGNEQRGRAAGFRHTHTTPDPTRVEVLHFIAYPMWHATEPLYQAWMASLPDRVDVVMLPLAGEGAKGRAETMVFFVARELGRGPSAHDEIVRQLARSEYRNLPPAERIARLLPALQIPLETFNAMAGNPARETVPEAHARWALQQHGRAFERARLSRVKIPRAWPTIVINGGSILDTHRKPDPVRTYQRANRLIRMALEGAPPTTDRPTSPSSSTRSCAPTQESCTATARPGVASRSCSTSIHA